MEPMISKADVAAKAFLQKQEGWAKRNWTGLLIGLILGAVIGHLV